MILNPEDFLDKGLLGLLLETTRFVENPSDWVKSTKELGNAEKAAS